MNLSTSFREVPPSVEIWTSTYGRAKARTYIQHLCEDTGRSPEDLPEEMNDREKWRERVWDIRPSGTTWWWCAFMKYKKIALCWTDHLLRKGIKMWLKYHKKGLQKRKKNVNIENTYYCCILQVYICKHKWTLLFQIRNGLLISDTIRGGRHNSIYTDPTPLRAVHLVLVKI